MFAPTHRLINKLTNTIEDVMVFSKKGIRGEKFYYAHNEYFYNNGRGEGIAIFKNGSDVVTGGYIRDKISFDITTQPKKVMSNYVLEKIK